MKILRPILVLVVVALALAACDAAPRPPDDEIIARFQARRAQIDNLVRMIRADRVLKRVDEDWTDPADPATVGISAGRIAEYRRILNSVGFRRGFYYDPPSGDVKFIAWSVGLAGSGASKSVLYLPGAPPAPLVDDLDTLRVPVDRGLLAYRHIDGPWYLDIEAD